MGRVAVLSEDLINKIAAGEVVERPASVVKELCENSLDAGATSIRVALEGGGLGRIRIIDDGIGMSREDAVMALSRHATSKLRDLDGLFAISTMGFRGEAVPAIASVSRFSVETSERGSLHGTRIEVDGGKLLTVEDMAAPGGTTLQVDDLFFNTPARRKFLKRESTELGHCEDALLRLALANPEVHFQLEHEGRSLLQSPPCRGDLRERLAHIFGAEVHPHLRPFDEKRLGIAVHGQLALPTFTFPNARGIYTFVNGRYIRDRGLNGSIGRAFGDLLAPGRQPVVVLFIDVDPRAVDVNVHPQKLEVRFADGRGVYDAVFTAMAKTVRLAMGVTAPVRDGMGGTPVDAQHVHAVERYLAQARDGWAASSALGADGAPPLPFVADAQARLAPDAIPAFGQARPELNDAPPEGYFRELKRMGTLAGRYWVCEGRGQSLVVVDPHALSERITLERLVTAWRKNATASQTASLFSSVVSLPPSAARALGKVSVALSRLGIAVEAFGGDSFSLSTVPVGMEALDWSELLPRLIELLREETSRAGRDADTLPVETVRELACVGAAAIPFDLPHAALTAMLEEVERAEFAVRTKHRDIALSEQLLVELDRRAGRGLDGAV